MSGWIFALYQDTPGVVIDADLMQAWSEAMARAGKELVTVPEMLLHKENPRRVDAMHIDRPGPAFSGEPDEKFDFLGLALSMPCVDVGTFAGIAERAEVQSWGGIEIHGFHRCLVIAPAQRDTLVALLRGREAAADERWKTYYAGWKQRAEERNRLAEFAKPRRGE